MVISKILLTGATGYVGGRLLKRLEAADMEVRCFARNPEFLEHRVGENTRVVRGDIMDDESVRAAMKGCSHAFYLIHSMGEAGGFAERDQSAAHNFAAAAEEAGLERIIYLGGLGNDKMEVSEHLESRHEVGRILSSYATPVIELRASIIIGSGSLSFEMIRALVERLPVMITPRWVSVEAQPIAIEDVIEYLLQSLDVNLPGSRILEIGGSERISYGNLMREYARQRGLRRYMIPVPLLTPYLSSLWLGLVTPVYARIGRKLIDGLRAPTVVHDKAAERIFQVRPMDVSQAIARALSKEDQEFSSTSWTDALSSTGAKRYGGQAIGTRLVDSREITIPCSPQSAFAPIGEIGGSNGWYGTNMLWTLRGWIDILAGGVGMRRSRPVGRELGPGDHLDFWRVERIDPPNHMYLRAEMRLPGRAWLKFEVEPSAEGTRIRQTAIFEPKGVWGRLYWYGIWPIHVIVFRRLLADIARNALTR